MIRFLDEQAVLEAAESLLAQAVGPVLVTSGWVRGMALDALFSSRVRARIRQGQAHVRLVYRLAQPEDLAITELDRLEELARELDGRLELRFSKRVHAKMIVAADPGCAVVTSSNLTPTGGFSRRAALGQGEWTNQEAGVLIDDAPVVADAARCFEEIWRGASRLDEAVVGLAVDAPSHEGLLAACIRAVRTGKFVVVEDDEAGAVFIGRIVRVARVDPSFPPLFAGEAGEVAGFEGGLGGMGADWRADRTIAALLSDEPKSRGLLIARTYRRPGAAFDLARIELLRELTDCGWVSVSGAPAPGSVVRWASDKEFDRLVFGGCEGHDGVPAVVVGHVRGDPALAVRVRAGSLLQTHWAVLGMTGSGKSTAVRTLLRGLAPLARAEGLRIVVIDPHGEHAPAAAGGGRVIGRGPCPLDRIPVNGAGELLELANLETQDRRKHAAVARAIAAGRAGGHAAFCEAIRDEGPGRQERVPVRWWDRLCGDGLLGEVALQREVLDVLAAGVAARDQLDRRRAEDRAAAAQAVAVLIEQHLPEPDRDALRGWFACRESRKIQAAHEGAPLLDAAEVEALEQAAARICFEPPEVELAEAGLTIVDLQATADDVVRAAIAGEIATRLFDEARQAAAVGRRRPALLVVEEAQQFAPEHASRRTHRSLGPLIQIATEGRKFGVCLVVVTQRPAGLSKGVLTQCGSQWIFRLANPADLEQVAATVEAASPALLRSVPALDVGTCLACGGAFGLPVFVRIVAEEGAR